MHDLRLAVRALRATPVVSIVAALSLALGIGANTAIFSLVNSLLLRALPVKAPSQLALVVDESDLGTDPRPARSLRRIVRLGHLPFQPLRRRRNAVRRRHLGKRRHVRHA